MIFRDNSNSNIDRLDWRLLRYSSVSIYTDDDMLQQHLEDLDGKGYEVANFECAGKPGKRLCKEVGSALGIETDQETLSWDAFDDYLYDPGRLTAHIPESGGLVFVLRGFDHFAAESPNGSVALTEILSVHSRIALMLGLRWIVLLDVDDPDFSVEPLQLPIKLNEDEAARRTNALVDWDSILADIDEAQPRAE